MVIHTGYQNADIITAVQCSVNTVKAIKWHMDSCNRDDEAMVCKKGHSTHSDCLWTPEFIQQVLIPLIVIL